jgi:hypothetical protein
MLERVVSKAEVEDALSSPLQLKDTKHGRKVALGLGSDGNYLIVIFEAGSQDLIVVTALRTGSDGAKRYGFTGI